ncbi:class I SAM-dependent methyltransferase [Rhizobium ruizarguesonis]|uniref:class I SAM-dependent methyltransferase n=1 Tax=Rhizobium ruizarguesonis TaxID=2081791 RepID=UPI00371C5C97
MQGETPDKSFGTQESTGESFEERGVVDNYKYRPPYPGKLFKALAQLSSGRGALLDIGCGPGKVARPMSDDFDRVIAVDPSARMIDLAKSLPGGRNPNIRWIRSRAENAPLAGARFNMTVAAASIHWMDHRQLFPLLIAHAKTNHLFVTITGDQPFEAKWQDDIDEAHARWAQISASKIYDAEAKRKFWDRYKQYVDVVGREIFLSTFSQSIDDFVRCQHSRDAFSLIRRQGLSEGFDAELREVLKDHAIEGKLHFAVRTKLTWHSIKPL